MGWHKVSFINPIKGSRIMSYEECIKACLDCAMDCESCLHKMMGIESHNDCPSCCRECLEICILCAQAMTRNSKYIKEYCRLCAEICDWCSEQCEEHEYDHCKRCAESCRRCAEECRKVAAWNYSCKFLIKSPLCIWCLLIYIFFINHRATYFHLERKQLIPRVFGSMPWHVFSPTALKLRETLFSTHPVLFLEHSMCKVSTSLKEQNDIATGWSRTPFLILTTN